jgi:hypothetical protein
MNRSTVDRALAPGHKLIWIGIFTFVHLREFV